LPGCVAVHRGAAGVADGGGLYVIDAGTAAVVRVEQQTGRAVGGPLPGGPAPWQAVPGPDGALLVLSAPSAGPQGLTRVVRSGRGWVTRPVPLEPEARGAVLAGDGDRYAVLAYRPAPVGGAPGCRLALVDLEAGAVVRTHDVCGAGESVRDVALDSDGGGPVAYVALWGGSAAAPDGEAGGGGRVVALAAATGAVLATRATAGVPDRVLLGPGPDGAGRRVYCLESTPPPPAHPESWGLVTLDAATLAFERAYALPVPPLWPALAPDGGHLYALTDRGGGAGRGVVDLDLTTGVVSRLLTLPGDGLGLAATAERLYVLDPDRGGLWAVDRRRGRLLGATAVGRPPVALTLRPAA
jgi:hypothetical protein